MKPKTLIAIFLTVPAIMFGQLRVDDNGSVRVGNTNMYTGYHQINLYTELNSTNGYIIGIQGISKLNTGSSNYGMSCGVYGMAYNSGVGTNCGVLGSLTDNSTRGAGIFGGSVNVIGYNISGKYAGFFYGNVFASGSITANSFLQSSDKRLKDNIRPLSSLGESTLEKVLNMNVVEYNYKRITPSVEIPDSFLTDEAVMASGVDPNQNHIGLIAQELQQLYPDLVREGQDGYLSVNYIELVPVLIRSIQELKQELDEVKGSGDEARKTPQATTVGTMEAQSRNVLYQNTPNPFKEKTIIRFKLADGVKDASVCFFDMSGKLLKKLPVSQGMESVSVNGFELGEGMFLYSLLVDGQEIDTKRMILSK